MREEEEEYWRAEREEVVLTVTVARCLVAWRSARRAERMLSVWKRDIE